MDNHIKPWVGYLRVNKWNHVPMGRELTEDEQKRIVRLLMAWIERQLETDAK